jgi:hypothetical protein
MKRAGSILALVMFVLAAAAACAQAAPIDFELYMNGRRIQNNDTISSTPSIEVRITSTASFNADSIRMAYVTVSTSVEVTDFTKDVISSTECFVSHKQTSPLSDGTYKIIIYVEDYAPKSTLFESTGLRVLGGSDLSLQGNPLNYPNPFDPSSGTYISYSLTRDASISINIFDLAGNNISKITRAAGSPGGLAGYNEVLWDGSTAASQTVGNGMYIYLIIADGAVAGKGKMIALKR